VAGDEVTVAATGTFADKNAGSGKTVMLANTFGGADAANYAIAGQSTAIATIAQKTVTVAGGGIGLRYVRDAWSAGVMVAWRAHGGASLTDDTTHSPSVLANVAYRF
jgi:hypothetical protein